MSVMTLPKSRRLLLPLAAAAALGLCAPMTAQVASAEPQPRMESARHNLLQARRDLRRASRDKGGHRVRALRLINQAIRQVQLGIRHDNRHTSGRERRYFWRDRNR